MGKELDVYRDWLGIEDPTRPLSYYQLLRVKKFEDNATKIRSHYRKMNTHVRKYGAGEYGRQSQKLLNELAKAMLCLTDAKRKREYDASLGRTDFGSGKVRSFEEILLGNKLIDSEQLKKARNYANAVGLEVRDAVLQQKLAEPEEVMMAYAESQGLPFIDLEDVQIDERLVPQIAPDTARSHSCIPFMIDGERLLMLSPNPILPDVEEELRLRFNKPVRTVLCTPKSINARIEKYYPPGAVQAEPLQQQQPAAAKPKAAQAEASTPEETKEPLTREEKETQWKKILVISFCGTAMLVMIGTQVVGLSPFAGMAVAAGAGAVAATIVAVVTRPK